MATSRNWGMLSLKSQYLWRDGARFFTEDRQPINKKLGGKAFERARNDLVKDGFLEVNDDIYTLKVHDAGQTGHDPDN